MFLLLFLYYYTYQAVFLYLFPFRIVNIVTTIVEKTN